MTRSSNSTTIYSSLNLQLDSIFNDTDHLASNMSLILKMAQRMSKSFNRLPLKMLKNRIQSKLARARLDLGDADSISKYFILWHYCLPILAIHRNGGGTHIAGSVRHELQQHQQMQLQEFPSASADYNHSLQWACTALFYLDLFNVEHLLALSPGNQSFLEHYLYDLQETSLLNIENTVPLLAFPKFSGNLTRGFLGLNAGPISLLTSANRAALIIQPQYAEILAIALDMLNSVSPDFLKEHRDALFINPELSRFLATLFIMLHTVAPSQLQQKRSVIMQHSQYVAHVVDLLNNLYAKDSVAINENHIAQILKHIPYAPFLSAIFRILNSLSKTLSTESKANVILNNPQHAESLGQVLFWLHSKNPNLIIENLDKILNGLEHVDALKVILEVLNAENPSLLTSEKQKFYIDKLFNEHFALTLCDLKKRVPHLLTQDLLNLMLNSLNPKPQICTLEQAVCEIETLTLIAEKTDLPFAHFVLALIATDEWYNMENVSYYDREIALEHYIACIKGPETPWTRIASENCAMWLGSLEYLSQIEADFLYHKLSDTQYVTIERSYEGDFKLSSDKDAFVKRPFLVDKTEILYNPGAVVLYQGNTHCFPDSPGTSFKKGCS